MGRSGSAIESGADDAVNPPDVDTMAWLCGNLQFSRYLEAIWVRKGAGLWQHISTQGWRKGEHHFCYFGAQTLQCTHGCKETPGLFLPALDLQPPSPAESHTLSAGREGLLLPRLEQ